MRSHHRRFQARKIRGRAQMSGKTTESYVCTQGLATGTSGCHVVFHPLSNLQLVQDDRLQKERNLYEEFTEHKFGIRIPMNKGRIDISFLKKKNGSDEQSMDQAATHKDLLMRRSTKSSIQIHGLGSMNQKSQKLSAGPRQSINKDTGS